MNILVTVLGILLGYPIGSIPWALIIGKVFFHKDIRNYGSGNLGGTNAGRVLGKPVGLLVIVLDAMKAFIVMVLLRKADTTVILMGGAAVCVGHCFPLFANFKGGKAVACTYGFLLGLGIFVTKDVVFSLIVPFLIFMILLCLFKMVSLASMVSLLCEALIGFLTYRNPAAAVVVLILALFVVYRHIPNIKKILNGKESKVSWIK